MVAHVFNPGIWEAEASVSDMKANLIYIENSETCLVYTELVSDQSGLHG